LLFSRCLPVGHAFPDKLSQVSSDDILLRRLLRTLLAVLLAQCPFAQRLRRGRLGHNGIASEQAKRN
jgi:hypothetical protein